MWVSDIIVPHEYKNYGGLQLGLGVAAVQDAVERWKEQRTSTDDHGDDVPAEGLRLNDLCSKSIATGVPTRLDSREPSPANGEDRDRAGELKSIPSNAPEAGIQTANDGSPSTAVSDLPVSRATSSVNMASQVILDAALSPNVLHDHLRLEYGPYSSPRPAIFTRSYAPSSTPSHGLLSPPVSPPTNSGQSSAASPICITVSEPIGHGSTGIVHRGVLTVTLKSEPCRVPIVVKLAMDEEPRYRPSKEFSIYQHLETKGVTGIPRAMGLFHTGADTACTCLVLTDEGASIWGEPESVVDHKQYGPTQRVRYHYQ